MLISMAKRRIRQLPTAISTARRSLFTDSAASSSVEPARPKDYRTLYRRLSALRGQPNGSVSETMDGWIKEGNTVTESKVRDFVRELRKYRDVKHALQLIDWMEERGMKITIADHVIRVDLIAKVKGINKAENYFVNLPEPAKKLAYSALLANYCRLKMVDKAFPLYEKMKELNLSSSSLVNNNLMTLYMKLGQPEMVITHFREMKAANISPDRVSYGLLLNSYASLNDIESAERVIKEMKEGGQVAPDWTIYCSLAACYSSSSLLNKSKFALKMAEKVMNRHDCVPYEYIISSYATIGNSAEVKRVWKLLKDAFPKTTNRSYLCMLSALRKLGDVDGLEQCFHEWESSYTSYDVNLVNVVVDAYLRTGLVEKAEVLWKKAVKNLENKVGTDFKMLEIFIGFYLTKGELFSASKYLEIMRSRGWKPRKETIDAFLKYSKEGKDVAGTKEFCKILKDLNCLDAEAYGTLRSIGWL